MIIEAKEFSGCKLRKLPSIGCYDKPSSFIHTNDEGYETYAPEWATPVGPDQHKKAALIIGTGGALSILPDLPVEMFIFVDNNRFIGDWNRRSFTTLGEVDSQGDYERLTYTAFNPLFRQMTSRRYTIREVKTGLNREIATIGRLHFLNKQQTERFASSKKALPERDILTVALDLQEEAEITTLAEALSSEGWVITHAHMTNVYEYQGPNQLMRHSLPHLPWHPRVKIIFSSIRPCSLNVYPTMRGVAQGIEDYLSKASLLLSPAFSTSIA